MRRGYVKTASHRLQKKYDTRETRGIARNFLLADEPMRRGGPFTNYRGHGSSIIRPVYHAFDWQGAPASLSFSIPHWCAVNTRRLSGSSPKDRSVRTTCSHFLQTVMVMTFRQGAAFHACRHIQTLIPAGKGVRPRPTPLNIYLTKSINNI